MVACVLLYAVLTFVAAMFFPGPGQNLVLVVLLLVATVAAACVGLGGLLKRGRRWRERLTVLAGSLLFAAVCVALVGSQLEDARRYRGRIPCASNLRQIGQALYLYANSHTGRYPDRLEDLVAAGEFEQRLLVCEDNDGSFGKPRVSIVYLAGGHKESDFKQFGVIAYDPGHQDGAFVLRRDGSVSWEFARDLAAELADRFAARPATTATSRSTPAPTTKGR